VTENKSKDSG